MSAKLKAMTPPSPRFRAALAAGAVAFLGACQAPESGSRAATADATSAATSEDAMDANLKPATLLAADEPTMEALRSALARAMNRARVELGPGDPTADPTVSVLPPRPDALEDRSTARPTLFDIATDGARCFVVRRDDGASFEIVGVACHALEG